MKSITGIWIDGKEARVITVGKGQGELRKIKSNIRSSKFKGGSRSKTPWGPMLKISESKFEARKKSEFIKYFRKVIDALPNSNFYEIYGPGQVKIKFTQFIEQVRQSMAERIVAIEPLDRITDNQFSAKIKDRATIYLKEG